MELNKIQTLLENIKQVESWVEAAKKDNDTYLISHYKAVLMGLNLALKIFVD